MWIPFPKRQIDKKYVDFKKERERLTKKEKKKMYTKCVIVQSHSKLVANNISRNLWK